MKRREFVSCAVAAAVGTALDLRSGHAASVPLMTSPSDAPTGANTGDLSELWPATSHAFRKALLQGTGFSFLYDGKSSGVAESISHRDLGTSVETTFRYGAGLEVIRTLTRLPGTDAIEYSVRVRNHGTSRSAAVHGLNALAISFDARALDGSYVISSGGGGGLFDGTYPPDQFAITEHYFNPTLPSEGMVRLTTAGGRSSNRDLPFYFVHNDKDHAGIFVGIGWTGQWESTITAHYGSSTDGAATLQLHGGIPNLWIELEPGEEITGPRILIGSYEGKPSNGSNQLRQLIRTHYTPKLGGEEFKVIATYDAWWGIEEKYDEALLRPLADAASAINQEYFLLDAAWYIGANGPEGFSGGVGNWEQVDATKFPSGLAHFANYVRSRNLKFGLWFEPERVHRTSLLAKQHPEWVIWLDHSQYGLLDYGRPEARRWVQEMMSRYITQLEIEYIRHDFNMDPLVYWESVDKPNRLGISQIRHIEGFYEVIDWIRQHHPRTVLECCASGGRRIDLETARRFHTYWISDDTIDPEVVRFHLQGINYFLPGNYSYVQYTLPAPTQKDFKPRDIDYLSCFGGAFGTGGRVDLWSAKQKERFSLVESVHKRVRRFLMEEYYPLLPQATDLNGWAGWQFHDPRTNSGFVQVFRQESAVASMSIAVFGLRPNDAYEFRDALSGATLRADGHAAMKNGLEFQLDPMSSRILLYESARHG